MILLFILIALNAFFLSLVLPWWSMILPGLFFGHRFRESPLTAFIVGFLAVFVAWSVHSSVINHLNEGVLSARIAQTFGVEQAWILIVITGVIGGVMSGIATMTRALFAQAQAKKS